VASEWSVLSLADAVSSEARRYFIRDQGLAPISNSSFLLRNS
jgi:hypothetical protein